MYNRPKGIESCRIWVDGCFDFTHHGHAGAMMQARQLGRELYVGVHSDEEILANKGPVVMQLEERMTAVEGCKWATKAIADAPYVTDPKVMDQYDCKYVVHGDDITTDADGNDCYQVVKDMGKFVVVKRTPNILTTDLVGRMLLKTKSHHIPKITDLDHPLLTDKENLRKFTNYATDETGLNPHSGVYFHLDSAPVLTTLVDPSPQVSQAYKQSIVYIDGGFDLFHPGHIEALRVVKLKAAELGHMVVVGLHEDNTINQANGLNYPIMTMFERSLCVLQCKYVDGIVLGAPFVPSVEFLNKLPGKVTAVYHGPTPIDNSVYDGIKADGLYKEIGPHKYDNVNTQFIVDRVLNNAKAYEERQKKKGWKAENEQLLREQELKRGN